MIDHAAPISIILVTSGSSAQKLLFRYPFTDPCCDGVQKSRRNDESLRKNPYTRPKPDKPSPSQTHFLQNGQLYGFSDSILATMLVPNTRLCETNFEENINQIKLVGYPLLVAGSDEAKFEDCMIVDDRDVMITMVHVVVALHSQTASGVVKHYQNICKMVGKALRHEEKRCRYLSTQREIMMAQRDACEKLPEAEQNSFELIVKASELASDLKDIFDSMCSKGIINVKINGCLNLNYCLPHIVHSGCKTMINELKFNQNINYIKPYHTILLMHENDDLLTSLPHDASPVLARLFRRTNHIKNFQTLCQVADISLPQIFQIVAHLVYWGKCTIIYPLAESNVYVLSENAPTEIDSKYAEEFVRDFPKQSLHNILARFSFPTTLGDYRNLLFSNDQQMEQARIVRWLLKRKMLKQLHTYVFIMPQPSLSDERISFEYLKLKPHEMEILEGFSLDEKRSLQKMSRLVDREDFTFFLSMSRYFRGKHHLEDIMYYENVPRSKLLILIDKFRSMLLTVQYEDSGLSRFIS